MQTTEVTPLSWGSLNIFLVLVLTIALFVVYRMTKNDGNRSIRIALVTFGGLLLLMYGVASVAFWLSDPVAVVRLAFDCVVVFLPASLFFLFIATRKESLFNQYATSLDRLGLLRRRQLRLRDVDPRKYPVESDERWRVRVKSYLDRFGAVYGTLPPQNVDAFLASLSGQAVAQNEKPATMTGDSFYSFEIKTVLPVFGASSLIALGWMMVLPPFPSVPTSAALVALTKDYSNAWYLWAAEPVLLPVSFAFLGAYFFSLQMIVKRFMRRDLGPNAYNAVSMRIILATLGVWIAVQCIDLPGADHKGWLFALSFAVGVFPLIVWQLIANALKRIPGHTIVLPNLEGTAALSQIDGLSVWHEARLEEEDIENVPNLVTADIVDLMLNTKIAPNRIIDWIDQALLLLVVPSRADRSDAAGIEVLLERNGIRTASALVAATHLQHGATEPVINHFPDPCRQQALALAQAVQLYPNYMLVQNWLATEPHFESDDFGGAPSGPPHQFRRAIDEVAQVFAQRPDRRDDLQLPAENASPRQVTEDDRRPETC
jgi:hypothetical protein